MRPEYTFVGGFLFMLVAGIWNYYNYREREHSYGSGNTHGGSSNREWEWSRQDSNNGNARRRWRSTDCSICRQTLEGWEVHRFRPCCHRFHATCLKSKEICPDCNQFSSQHSSSSPPSSSPSPSSPPPSSQPSFDNGNNGSARRQGKDTDCSICGRTLELEEICRLSPCRHIFHVACLKSKEICPDCNQFSSQHSSSSPPPSSPPPSSPPPSSPPSSSPPPSSPPPSSPPPSSPPPSSQPSFVNNNGNARRRWRSTDCSICEQTLVGWEVHRFRPCCHRFHATCLTSKEICPDCNQFSSQHSSSSPPSSSPPPSSPPPSSPPPSSPPPSSPPPSSPPPSSPPPSSQPSFVNGNGNDVCLLCKKTSVGERMVTLPCHHIFHYECEAGWSELVGKRCFVCEQTY